ncbi:phosphate starvation-inducible protein PhoH [Acidihalobacter aeolianus]|uniref:PhoH-like protein n=1 Tax=Acidihalobacter aeolianus TaxID=2792603 RepID=A0A1D8K9A7_9GAMM|nr:PhoH family protein [Acidihalobacter aeolianus]AOV17559.1 phosphate starvation-inducible protein PhoH [Acidihalobacter aeolianus]
MTALAHPASLNLTLEPASTVRLANLCGQFDEHLRLMERRLGVELNNRGGHFTLIGQDPAALDVAARVLRTLYESAGDEEITPAMVHLSLQECGAESLPPEETADIQAVELRTRRGMIKARGPRQARYLHQIQTNDLAFGIGPAGTGKTYLAVASAVDALERDAVRRLVLVRPAVEAGERLGFLPGDLTQKVDPYLRPIYDALYEMLGPERVVKLLERNVIEIAPLAFMRGRTLNDAFVILDEAQNTTIEQMKMFLTRIGFGTTAVVTGDVTQVDLPRNTPSGLRQAIEVLKAVESVSFTFFNASDVVRHPLVQRIVRAYASFEQH